MLLDATARPSMFNVLKVMPFLPIMMATVGATPDTRDHVDESIISGRLQQWNDVQAGADSFAATIALLGDVTSPQDIRPSGARK